MIVHSVVDVSYTPNRRLFIFKNLVTLCKSPRAWPSMIVQHLLVTKMVNRLGLGQQPILKDEALITSQPTALCIYCSIYAIKRTSAIIIL